jgi:hypothetical protein
MNCRWILGGWPGQLIVRTIPAVCSWHVGDLEQCPSLVREAPNNGHVRETAKRPLMTRRGHRPRGRLKWNTAVPCREDWLGF